MSELSAPPPPVAALPGARDSAPVTKLLIAVNTLIFAAMVSRGISPTQPSVDGLIAWGANQGLLTLSGEWWRLGSCMFIHIGALHIACNMYVLWDGGQLAERIVGSAAFLGLYLVAGLVGSATSLLWHPLTVSAGASGAVFGVYGALLGFCLPLRRAVSLRPLARLRNSILLFIGLNIALGMSMDGIDNAAHIGGLVSGFVSGLVLSRRPGQPPRLARLGIVIVIGAGALGAAYAVAPFGVVHHERAVLELRVAEGEVLDLYNDYVKRNLPSDDFARALDTVIIPRWRDARLRFDGAAVGELPVAYASQRAHLQEYLRLRERAFELTRDACRTTDPDAAKRLADQAAALAEQAERLFD